MGTGGRGRGGVGWAHSSGEYKSNPLSRLRLRDATSECRRRVVNQERVVPQMTTRRHCVRYTMGLYEKGSIAPGTVSSPDNNLVCDELH